MVVCDYVIQWVVVCVNSVYSGMAASHFVCASNQLLYYLQWELKQVFS